MAEYEGPFGSATPVGGESFNGTGTGGGGPRRAGDDHYVPSTVGGGGAHFAAAGSRGGGHGGGHGHLGGVDASSAALAPLLVESEGGGAAIGSEGFGDHDDHAEHLERPTKAPRGETLRLVATIVKSFIGSGVLFLPKAFQSGGWLFSSIIMLAMAGLAQLTIMRLVACRQRVAGSYSYVGYKAYGRRAQIAVDISLVLSQAGFGCVYIVFIARNMLQLVNVDDCWVPGTRLWAFMLVEFFLLVPLTWVRRMASFGWTSLLANIFIGAGLVGILAYVGSEWAAAPTHLTVSAMNVADFPLFLGTAVYAFEGIGMVVPIYDSLSVEGQARYPYTLTFTLIGIALVYVVIGMVPYLYLDGVAHVVLQDAVTLNLPEEWWAYCIVVAYCIALVFSYPLMMFPAIKILERGAGPYLWNAASPTAAHWRRNGFRAFVVAVTVLVSYLGASQLNNLVALVGCFACTPLMFIFPTMFHQKLVGPRGLTRLSNWAIALLGVGVFLFATYEAIATWDITTIDACPGNGHAPPPPPVNATSLLR